MIKNQAISIPGCCLDCRFYNVTEDGEAYCAVYDKAFEPEYDDEEDQIDKPDWCKASFLVVHEC